MDDGAIDILHAAERVRPAHDLIAAKLAEAAEPIIESDRREEWLAKRREGIGASEAAAVLGIDPWSTPIDLYLRKARGSERDRTPRERWRMQLGHRMQADILSELSAATGLEIRPCDVLYRSRRHAFMLATPDAMAFAGREPVLAEAKLVGDRMEREWEAGIPLYVQAQVAHQAIVLGVARVFVAVLFIDRRAGNPFEWFEYRLGDNVEEWLVEREGEFWRSVLSGEVPALDFEALTKESIARLYPHESEGKVVTLPEEALALDAKIQKAREEEAKARANREHAEARLEALMADAADGLLPGGAGRYSWRTVNRAGYTVEPTSFRQLRRHKK